jgi:hypothetical protein
LTWLRDKYSFVVERVHWLDRMRTTTEPLRAPSFNRMPRYLTSPAINLVCLPAMRGLIRGRMDWQFPDLYVNAWAVAGYRCATEAARLLGDTAAADRWESSGGALDTALATEMLPAYGKNDRDSIVAPYPSGALGDHRDSLRNAFGHWYRTNRFTSNGDRQAETLWSYFEAAQAQNAVRLGFVEEAWASLAPMILDQGNWRLSAFGEGIAGGFEALPFGGDEQRRGWLSERNAQAGNMPHGWTSAEVISAIRSLFIDDETDHIVVGPGVPEEWIRPGARFGIRELPSRLGPVTFTVTVDESNAWNVDFNSPMPWRLSKRGV